MEKKYELVKDDFVMVNGNKLYRIKSLVDIEPWVAVGQLGGYIEKEENLSHEGTCWVFDHAMVYYKAVIKEDAQVSLNAQVYGQAIMSGQSMATDHAKVYDFAEVRGDALIHYRAEVYGYSVVEDNAAVGGNSKVYGHAYVGGISHLEGFVEVYDYARLRFNCLIEDQAKVYGHAIIDKDAFITDHATIHGNAMLKGHIRVSGYASIFKDAKVYGSANIDFKVTGEDEVIVYTDPTNPRYIITASSKQDWFNSFGFSGRSKDFMEEANKLGEEKASRYKAIVDLHLALYNVR